MLGHLAFDESNRLLNTASRFTAPFLARWMSPTEAGRVAEWATRIVLTYAIAPSAQMDITDAGRARHLVETFVLPGIRALHGPTAADRRHHPVRPTDTHTGDPTIRDRETP